MMPDLPRLEFISLASIFFHEQHDERRTLPLIERIRESGFFRNPPIVTPLGDNTGRYMVLDGANRVTALREMGFRDVLVQVVRPGDAGFNLQNWNHVVWELPPQVLFEGIGDVPGVSLLESNDDESHLELRKFNGLALLQIPDGSRYVVSALAGEMVIRVGLLNAIVDSYKERASYDRTGNHEIRPLLGKYPNLSGLVIFPHFQIEDVLFLAGAGCLLPSGITRFAISPRAMHVNYPLYELASDRPLDEKNAALQQWVRKRLERKGIRYYAEATFLYDE